MLVVLPPNPVWSAGFFVKIRLHFVEVKNESLMTCVTVYVWDCAWNTLLSDVLYWIGMITWKSMCLILTNYLHWCLLSINFTAVVLNMYKCQNLAFWENGWSWLRFSITDQIRGRSNASGLYHTYPKISSRIAANFSGQ